jgi:hypothetical protein
MTAELCAQDLIEVEKRCIFAGSSRLKIQNTIVSVHTYNRCRLGDSLPQNLIDRCALLVILRQHPLAHVTAAVAHLSFYVNR